MTGSSAYQHHMLLVVLVFVVLQGGDPHQSLHRIWQLHKQPKGGDAGHGAVKIVSDKLLHIFCLFHIYHIPLRFLGAPLCSAAPGGLLGDGFAQCVLFLFAHGSGAKFF